MSAYQQIGPARIQFVDANGAPLVGGSVATYIPATFTPVTTYQDPNGDASNTNPQDLDSIGSMAMWYAGTLRMIVKDVNGVTIYDDVASSTGAVPVGAIIYTGPQTLTHPQQEQAQQNLGIVAGEIVLYPQSGDISAKINAAFATVGGGGTVRLSPGQFYLTPGNVAFTANGQSLLGSGLNATTITLNGPLSAIKAGIIGNFLQNLTIADFTLDGAATVLYNYAPTVSTPLAGTPSFTVKAGQQYKVALRGNAAATLTITGGAGVFATPLVVTGIGMTPGATIVYGYVTALINGTATMTPSGNVYYVSVMENGGPSSSLVSLYQTIGALVRTNMINIDYAGLVTNGCAGIDVLLPLCKRSAATWDQNYGALFSNQAGTAGTHILRCGSRIINTGVTTENFDLRVESGVEIQNVGYSSCVTTLVGSRSNIGQIICGGNALWPDMDDTVPAIHELYGTGVLDHPYIVGNGGGGIYLGGAWKVISPIVYNTCAYFAANTTYTVAGLTLGYAGGGTLDSAGSEIFFGEFGDTRSGGSRTQGYGIQDQNSSVHNTAIYDPTFSNNITAPTQFLGTVLRTFRGRRFTYSQAITSGAIANGAAYNVTLTTTGTIAGQRIVGWSSSGDTLGAVATFGAVKADAIALSLINLTGGSVTPATQTISVIVEQGPNG